MPLPLRSNTPRAFIVPLLIALAFALGFAEFVLIGITPDVAESLGEPLTRIGDLVGFYALACAVATPVVSLAGARFKRFNLMAALLVVFNLGNFITMFADTYLMLTASRMLAAATSGTLLALALTYVPEIVEAHKVARVIALVLAAFSVSSVIGVPIGTMLADAFGWKAAYAAVLVCGLVATSVLAALPRSSQVEEQARIRTQLRLLGDARVLVNIAMILAGAASTYVFYTYLTPILEGIMGFGPTAVSAILLVFGAACVVSNLLSGWMANRFGLHGLPVSFALHAVLLALLAVTIPQGVVGLVDILAVGLVMYVMNSTVQMLFQDVARTSYPSAVTFSASLHPMSFNAGIAIGSFVGGATVNAGGLLATGPVGALLALAAGGCALVLSRLVAHRHATSATKRQASAHLE